eukprot:9469780-Pyramimonas_sp.AAC.1
MASVTARTGCGSESPDSCDAGAAEEASAGLPAVHGAVALGQRLARSLRSLDESGGARRGG